MYSTKKIFFNKFLISILILFIVPISSSFSQSVGIGNWKDYSPYRDIISIVKNNNIVYGATTNGIIALNINDNSIEKLTKINALSDIGISKLSYNTTYNFLLVAYRNGNVDIIKDNQTTNFSQIKKSSIIGDKSLYNIFSKGKLAYVSCGFGIVVIDLERLEIKDTYVIGPGGTQMRINEILVTNGFIYAATEKGLYQALETNNFLNDFNSWSLVANLPNNSNEFNAIVESNGNLITNFKGNGTTIMDTVYYLDSGNWKVLNVANGSSNKNIYAGNGRIIINHFDSITILDNNNVFIEKILKYNSYWTTKANQMLWDGTDYWIGDERNAIIRATGNESSDITLPDGPFTALSLDIDVEDGHLWGSTGDVTGTGWNSTYSLAGVFHYDIIANKWEIYPGECFGSGPNAGVCVYDFLGVAVNPNEPGKGYGCTFSPKGVVEFENESISTMYDSSNSSLQPSLVHLNITHNIADAVFDEDGNMWVANSWVNNPLVVKATNGNWNSFYCGSEPQKQIISQIIVDKTNNYKWLLVEKRFVVAYNSGDNVLDNSDDQYKTLKIGEGNGNLHALPLCISEDLDGEIWIGTEEGVAIIYSPENIFNGGDFDAQRIKIEQDGNVEYLLSSEVITSISIDGGNRKWIGTTNSGVFVFSPDGQELIHHFTFENSPLYANYINDIAIDQQSGEVFFSTEEGLLSYRGEATEGGVVFQDVYTFPNPIQPGYEGPITIKGLMKDSDIRITDLAGNIVFATKSVGGQAIWYGKNLDGEKVKTGIYLVYLAGPEGRKKEVTKILFLN
jgi:ligand-binding sensor domain-containing protein